MLTAKSEQTSIRVKGRVSAGVHHDGHSAERGPRGQARPPALAEGPGGTSVRRGSAGAAAADTLGDAQGGRRGWPREAWVRGLVSGGPARGSRGARPSPGFIFLHQTQFYTRSNFSDSQHLGDTHTPCDTHWAAGNIFL